MLIYFSNSLPLIGYFSTQCIISTSRGHLCVSNTWTWSVLEFHWIPTLCKRLRRQGRVMMSPFGRRWQNNNNMYHHLPRVSDPDGWRIVPETMTRIRRGSDGVVEKRRGKSTWEKNNCQQQTIGVVVFVLLYTVLQKRVFSTAYA